MSNVLDYSHITRFYEDCVKELSVLEGRKISGEISDESYYRGIHLLSTKFHSYTRALSQYADYRIYNAALARSVDFSAMLSKSVSKYG